MPQGTIVIKNGKAYDSADVVVDIDGEVYDEIKEIVYNTEQEHQVNHSLYAKATSWSKGKITDTSSVTVYMKDSVRLEKKGGGNLLNLRPFNINVSFVDEYNEIINDTITAKFKSQGRTVNGEMGLSQQYELFTLDVKYQTQ